MVSKTKIVTTSPEVAENEFSLSNKIENESRIWKQMQI